MKKATTPPWMPPPDYGRQLTGFGINLLVVDIEPAIAFQTQVLGLDVVHADPDFAVTRWAGQDILFHADHTYGDNPLSGSLSDAGARGIGAELRLYGLDPDAAESRARQHGYTVLSAATDKPHGLREVYVLDGDGYLWVPSAPRDD